MSSAIKLSGRGDGLEIRILPGATFGKIVCATEKKINELKKFLQGSDVHISFVGSRLTAGQRAILEHKIIKSAGKNTRVTFSDKKEKYVTMYKGTVRAGTVLKSKSDLLVIGDVNPGAYLYAQGNIAVMGSLRGFACAGENGDATAFVAANDMRPVQLRIAGIIARSPGETKKIRAFPEIATALEGKITVSPIKV